jgi:hypothetical protein
MHLCQDWAQFIFRKKACGRQVETIVAKTGQQVSPLLYE